MSSETNVQHLSLFEDNDEEVLERPSMVHQTNFGIRNTLISLFDEEDENNTYQPKLVDFHSSPPLKSETINSTEISIKPEPFHQNEHKIAIDCTTTGNVNLWTSDDEMANGICNHNNTNNNKNDNNLATKNKQEKNEFSKNTLEEFSSTEQKFFNSNEAILELRRWIYNLQDTVQVCKIQIQSHESKIERLSQELEQERKMRMVLEKEVKRLANKNQSNNQNDENQKSDCNEQNEQNNWSDNHEKNEKNKQNEETLQFSKESKSNNPLLHISESNESHTLDRYEETWNSLVQQERTRRVRNLQMKRKMAMNKNAVGQSKSAKPSSVRSSGTNPNGKNKGVKELKIKPRHRHHSNEDNIATKVDSIEQTSSRSTTVHFTVAEDRKSLNKRKESSESSWSEEDLNQQSDDWQSDNSFHSDLETNRVDNFEKLSDEEEKAKIQFEELDRILEIEVIEWASGKDVCSLLCSVHEIFPSAPKIQIPRNPTPDIIRRAYMQIVKVCHPDKVVATYDSCSNTQQLRAKKVFAAITDSYNFYKCNILGNDYN